MQLLQPLTPALTSAWTLQRTPKNHCTQMDQLVLQQCMDAHVPIPAPVHPLISPA